MLLLLFYLEVMFDNVGVVFDAVLVEWVMGVRVWL